MAGMAERGEAKGVGEGYETVAYAKTGETGHADYCTSAWSSK